MTFDDNSECIKLLQTEPNFDLNNFNIRNKDGVTPFEIATIMNQIQHIELLLAQKGTDIINVQNERGLNSLFLR